ncbi:MAG TPA: glycosyltransferase [Candidatus Dormibacteraeota bacterium]|nr:glycosyltransferase [Candidatus Dormibacteraeota bacterium]
MNREEAQKLLIERVERRRDKDFPAADALRDRLRASGWDVVDNAQGSELQALKAPASTEQPAIPRAVTLLTVMHGWKPDAERWLLSVFTHCKADFEALIVDNSGDTRIAAWLDSRAAERLRSVKLDPPLGFAAAVNAGIEAAAGELVILFDPGVELKGDAVSPLIEALADPSVVVAGPYGLRGQGTMKEFAESAGPEVDAIEGYCMAFRRGDAQALEGFDLKFRFYRIADIEFSFRLRDRGGRAVAVSGLPLEKHEHRLWETTDPSERDRLSRRNMYRFLDRWGDRADLLVGDK